MLKILTSAAFQAIPLSVRDYVKVRRALHAILQSSGEAAGEVADRFVDPALVEQKGRSVLKQGLHTDKDTFSQYSIAIQGQASDAFGQVENRTSH